MVKKAAIIIAVCVLSVSVLTAQSASASPNVVTGTAASAQTDSDSSMKTRPKVGLVLSGGGAKGFAQIAVLKALDDMGIPVDMVIGSSSGALVGGLYAAGYTADDIYTILKGIDWPYVFSDQAVHPFDRYFQQIYNSYYFLSAGLSREFDLKIGNSFLTGQHVLEIFKDLTVKIPSNTDFDTLPVPYRSIAVDLLTGEAVVLDSGDLSEAMRASMSLPGLFSPYKIGDRTYIDGGIIEHLPVQIARDLGCDIVIAVDTGDDLVQNLSSFDANPVVALNQMLNITQSKKNKAESADADLVIHPALAKYTLLDFYRIDEMIKLGEEAVRANYAALLDIRERLEKIDPAAVVPNSASQSAYASLPWLTVEELRVEGAVATDMTFINSQFRYIAGKPLTLDVVSRFMNTIYQRGNYTLVMPYIYEENGKGIMELYMVQSASDDHILRLAMTYESTISYESTSSLVLTPNVTLRDLTGKGSVISFDFSFVNELLVQMRYLQPITSRFFIEASADYGNTYDIFFQTFEFPVYLGYKTQFAGAAFGAGVGFGSNSWLRTEARYEWIDSSISIPDVIQTNPTNMEILATVEFGYSNENSSEFPMNGATFLLTSVSGFPLNGSSPFFQQFDAYGHFLIPVNKELRFSIAGRLGTDVTQTLGTDRATGPFFGYTLADREFFPQITNKVAFGSHVGIFAGSMLWRPFNPLTPLGGEVFFTVTGAFGNIWNDYNQIFSDGVNWVADVGMGVRVNSGISLRMRVGAGTENNRIKPFFSIDIGALVY